VTITQEQIERMSEPENPPAFPNTWEDENEHGVRFRFVNNGMSLRDWFAGQAFPAVIGRDYPEWQLKAWFGSRTCLTREKIAARAAYALADAMLAARGEA
jgi:hypothetical protein